MGYQFSGFFVKDTKPDQINSLDEIEGIKLVEKPFKGIGISVPKFKSKDPSDDELFKLANDIGLTPKMEWMFIVYECFGGQMDYLFGYINKNNETIGPVQESAWDKLESAYIEFMHSFGIGKNKALKFEPFERGFFCE